MLISCSCAQRPQREYLPQIGTQESAHQDVPEYSFGVPPLRNAVRLFEAFEPIMDEINRGAQKFRVKLETAKDYTTYEIKVRDRKLAFAILNPHVVIAAERLGYRIIGRTGDKVRGVVVVRRNSMIRTVRDLKWAPISFGSRTDLPGTLMPKAFLLQSGLNVEKRTQPRYVGSQESALMNVHFGRSAAACVSASSWETFRRGQPGIAEELRVRWTTEPLVGLGVLVRRDVPQEDVRAVSEVLFSLHRSEPGRRILESIGVSHLRAAGPEAYDGTWEFLQDYRRMFGRTPALGDPE